MTSKKRLMDLFGATQRRGRLVRGPVAAALILIGLIGLGLIGPSPTVASAAGGPSVAGVPGAVQKLFDEKADAYLAESAEDAKDYVQANPKVKERLASGATPHASRVVPELRLRYPAFDLREGELEKAPRPLPEALFSEGRYCAAVTIDGLFTDSVLCASLTKDPADEDFSDQTYSSGLLDHRTELPSEGYISTLSGLFTYDVATQTVTAMDDLALQNVPQGTVSVSELQTALARGDAERTLFFEKYGPRGGGDFPLFGGSADERAKHEAEIASLLAGTGTDTDGEGAEGASAGSPTEPTRPAPSGTLGASAQTPGTQARSASGADPSAARGTGEITGVAVLVALVAGLSVAGVRRRRRASQGRRT